MPLIRPVTPADLPRLLPLVQGLARHHGDEPAASEDSLARDLFGDAPWFFALVAAEGEVLAGYAALLRLGRLHFGQRGMDLHHLFIAEPFRRQGLGKALVTASVELARSKGCDYMVVGTHADNAEAQAYYPRLGFQPATGAGVRFFRLIDAAAPDRDQ